MVYVLQTKTVRVISKPAILEFSERHSDALVPLVNWYRITRKANWNSLAEKHYPLPGVSPNESLKALMEERGLKHKDIWPVLGNKGATTEILSGRRSISKAQAKRLSEFFRVPVDLFI